MGALSGPAASDSLAFHSPARFRGPSSRTTSSPSSVGGRRQVVSERQQVVRSDGQPSRFALWPAELRDPLAHFPTKGGFWVFVARLYRLNPRVVPALCGSARQPAADLIWQSKVSPSLPQTPAGTVAALPQVPQSRSWRWALCFPVVTSCSHNLIKRETHSVKLKIDSPFWVILRQKEEERGGGGGIAVRAGTTSRRQNTWPKWNFIAFSCRSSLTEWEHWMNWQSFGRSSASTKLT